MEEKDSSIEALEKKLQEFLDSERMKVMKNNVKGFVKTCLMLSLAQSPLSLTKDSFRLEFQNDRIKFPKGRTRFDNGGIGRRKTKDGAASQSRKTVQKGKQRLS